MRALWGLWATNWASGRHRIAFALAQKFCALAASRSDPNDRLVGERLTGVSQHFLGELRSARRHLEHMLAHYVSPVQKSHIIRFQSDQRVTSSTFLGRILWLQGFPDQARRVAQESVNQRHAMSLSYVLAHGACPIALWAGDLGLAERYVGILIDLSTRYSRARWRAFGRSHQGVIAIKRGDLPAGLQLLRSGLDELGEVNASFRYFMFLGEMAEALGRVGQIGEGLSSLEEAIARAGETEERWTLPSCCASRASCCCCKARPVPQRRPSITFGRRSSGPARRAVLGIARRHESCASAPRSGPAR